MAPRPYEAVGVPLCQLVQTGLPVWFGCCRLNKSTAPDQAMRSLTSSIRSRVRATLAANGPQTCSQVVLAMGLDPKRHKGTIHAVMVDMEAESILWAPRVGKRQQRHLWHLIESPRKRDRLRAVLMGL